MPVNNSKKSAAKSKKLGKKSLAPVKSLTSMQAFPPNPCIKP